MERYQHIIRASFFGHTHDQYWGITMSVSNPGKPVQFSQIGPSGTPYTENNPAYALIDVDAETMLPINWRIYAFDLATANEEGNVPEIFEMVNYSNDYLSGQGLSNDQVLDLTNRLATDSNLFWQIHWDKHRRVGPKTVGSDA